MSKEAPSSYTDKQRFCFPCRNVVKAFYSSGVLYDILLTFGELSEEALNNRKYAKYKAAYIHNCLKNGETPIPGPFPDDEDSSELGGEAAGGDAAGGEAAGGDAAAEGAAAATPPEDAPAPEDDEPPVQPTTPSPPAPRITPPTAEEVLNNPNKLPSPPVEEEKPGGFEPYVPTAQPHAAIYQPIVPIAGVQITPDQMITAQKYCKYAGSALNYDDVKTAIENLQKALKLLSTGSE